MRLVAEEFRQGGRVAADFTDTSYRDYFRKIFGFTRHSARADFVQFGVSVHHVFLRKLDLTSVWLSALGLFFLGASMMAIGLFASTLSQHQMVSAVAGFIMLLVLWMLDSFAGNTGSALQKWLDPFALTKHFDNFTKGVLSGPDVLYYVTLTGVFLLLSIQIVERKRWR